MMEPEQIETLIRQGMVCDHLQVGGDGRHFEAVVVSGEFLGMSRIQRHQRVNQTLKPYLDTGELHALSLKTYTPEEWSARG